MTKKGLFQRQIKCLGLKKEDFLWIDVIECVEGERPKYAILFDERKRKTTTLKVAKSPIKSLNMRMRSKK